MKKQPQIMISREPLIKYVKKARQWCKTTWDEKGIQKQDWSDERPLSD